MKKINQPLRSRWQGTHPLVVVTLLFGHVVTSFLWDSPLLVTGQFCFLLGWITYEGYLSRVWPFIWMSSVFLVVFFFVGPLFGSNGVTFLWKGPLVPVIGRLDLTWEEVVYGYVANVRLLIMLLSSALYQWLVDHDRFLFQFAKVAPRLVMTAVMAVRLVPFLRQELMRITEVAKARGIVPRNASLRERMRYASFLLKPLLHSALEGSWMTAETLYARGFGSGPRSFYVAQVMRGVEKIGLGLVVLGMLVAVAGKVLRFGECIIYPRIVWYDPFGDAMFVGFLCVVWSVPLVWLGRRGAE